jgi:hypothetical protein
VQNKPHFGPERTFTQDPKYSIRLLVDIAIRALSPAINDPTTALQAIDQIEDLLRRISQCDLQARHFEGHRGCASSHRTNANLGRLFGARVRSWSHPAEGLTISAIRNPSR